MNYTKGKWELNSYRPNNGRIVLRTGSQDNDAFVGNREIAVASSHGKTHEEMKANAHLIAAAPEMYERLKEMIEIINRIPLYKLDVEQIRQIIKAKLALQKAKGEQQ